MKTYLIHFWHVSHSLISRVSKTQHVVLRTHAPLYRVESTGMCMSPTGCGLHKEKIRQPLSTLNPCSRKFLPGAVTASAELMLLSRRRECPTTSGPWYLAGQIRDGFAKLALEAAPGELK